MNKYLPALILVLFFWLYFNNIYAKNIYLKAQSLSKDSSRVTRLNKQFEEAINQKKYTRAIGLGKQVLDLSDRYLLIKQKIKALRLFGKLHSQTNKTMMALSYYLQAESVCINYDFTSNLSIVYYDLGLFYQKQAIYHKAIQYFKKSYDLKNKNKSNQALTDNLEHMAFCYYVLNNYETSHIFYERLSRIYRNQAKESLFVKSLERLSIINSLNKRYQKAISYNLKLVQLYKKRNETISLSSTYNNLGFLYQRTKRPQQAIDYFRLSLGIIEQKNLAIKQDGRVNLLINTGVAYTNLISFKRARKQFEQATQLLKNNSLKRAEIHNYAGSNYYLSGNNYDAINEIERAIALARPKQAWQVLSVSYALLARIHEQEKNTKKAKEYKIRHLAALRKIKEIKNQRIQQMNYNQALLEQQERRIKNALAQQRQLDDLKNLQEKQAKDLILKDNLLKLKQNELALLRKAKELDIVNVQKAQLDKIRQKQALLLAEGMLREEKLASEKAKTAFVLERERVARKLRAERNKRQLQELIQQKKLQKQEIEKQKIKEKYGIGITVTVVLVLLLVFWLLISTRKSRKKEQIQKMEISEKNAEISAQNDFLQCKQEEIIEANILLKEKNIQISHSIKAALTIQEAILPTPQKINRLLPNHFIIYLPKDIVSGDFYWLEKIEGKTILIAADCTGHGIPGAFMSMIGNDLLNSIILLQGVLEPKQILTRLNEEIVHVLQQKDKGYRNGMDVALVIWEESSHNVQLTFAGAKRPLYLLQQNIANVQKIKGDRYSIGVEEPIYSQEMITLQKGDSIYLSSDGYIDQNNINRKKIGSRKFEELLLISQKYSIKQRQQAFEKFLMKHMEGALQRDDILLIGIEF
ncbi:MAG TPA: serine/threonine protein kinase [Microscillaceae bacterium]|nr:serine/threonine protein kinase [Microscillaceae bacterium]